LMRRSINPEPRLVVVPHQTHGSRIYVVEPAGVWEGRPGASSFPDCDGLVTSAGGVVIGVSSADCIPLFAFDDASGTLGIAHCGWRGIAAGIVEAMVASLEGAGAGRSGTRFLIGVSIGSCCYEVGHELLGAFSVSEVDECVGKARSEGERRMFDLKKLVARRLAEQGIDRDAVFTDNTCTSCRRDLLCSYRAHGSACGRMYSYLMKRVGER
jgi:YfiH family protein